MFIFTLEIITTKTIHYDCTDKMHKLVRGGITQDIIRVSTAETANYKLKSPSRIMITGKNFCQVFPRQDRNLLLLRHCHIHVQ